MKRFLALILAVLMLIPPVFADKIEYEYVPYEEEEFPIWSHELRRAESIFFGSLVLTFPVAMGVYTIGKSLGMPTPSESYQEVLIEAGIAAGISLVIAFADWLIGKLS